MSMQLPVREILKENLFPETFDRISEEFEAGNNKNVYLLSGPCLIGKSELALSIARNVVARRVWDLDVLILDAEFEKTGIRELRDLQANLNKSAHDSNKICIIRAVENLSVAASNSLLKILEDTPRNVTFFLTCNNTHKLLDTIVSRCQVVRLVGNKSTDQAEEKVKFFDKIILKYLFETEEEFAGIYSEFFELWNEFKQSGNEKLFKEFLPDVNRKTLKLLLEICVLDIQNDRGKFDVNLYASALETCMMVRNAIDKNSNIKLGMEVLNLKLGQLYV